MSIFINNTQIAGCQGHRPKMGGANITHDIVHIVQHTQFHT